MKALLFEEPGRANVREVEVPAVGVDEMLIQLKSVGICHSDFELLAGNYIIPIAFPTIPGHEWAGEVVEVGKSVTGYKPGDRVVGECVIEQDHFGFSISGAMAEYFKVRPEWLHKLPAELSFTDGALVEPFTCAYYAARVAGNVDASDDVVVFGAGPIGQCCVAAVKGMGAHTIVIDPVAERRQIARQIGADEVLDPAQGDLVAQVKALTGGRGASVVLEASGNLQAMASTFEVAGQEGRIVQIGINIGDKVPAPLGLIQSKELQLRGTIGSPGVWPAAIRFLARTGLDLTKIVTACFPLAQGLNALDAARDTKNNIKVHIQN